MFLQRFALTNIGTLRILNVCERTRIILFRFRLFRTSGLAVTSNLHLAIEIGWYERYIKRQRNRDDMGSERAMPNSVSLCSGGVRGKCLPVHYRYCDEIISWFCCKLIQSSVE